MLALEDVRKPALMRTIFRLGSVYSAQELTRRRSSPRLMVELSVGASLLARAPEGGFGLSWWREGDDEVEKGASLETSVNTRWVVRPSCSVAPSEL